MVIAGIRRGENVAVAGLDGEKVNLNALEQTLRKLHTAYRGQPRAAFLDCDLVVVAVPAGRVAAILRACGKHIAGGDGAGDVAIEYHLDSENVTDHQWLSLISLVDDHAGEVSIAWPRKPGDTVHVHAGERTVSIPAEAPA